MTRRGKFISFEGGEGVGKSTQVVLIAQALAERGITVDVTREPGGTDGAEAIRNLLLHHDGEAWGERAEALLFAAARSDHVEKRINPALDRGEWILCDRYIDSTRAYQGGGGGLDDDAIMDLHRVGSGGLLPDLTILLQANPEATAARLAARDGSQSDRIGGRDSEYHARVASAFAKLAEAEPTRFAIIDGTQGPETVHEAVMSAVENRLGLEP